jgi:hypothetical protein
VCNITEPVIRILLVHIVLIRWVKCIFYYRYSYSVKEAYSKQIFYCNYVQSTQIQNWRVPFCFIIYILFILNYLSRLKCNLLPLLSRKNKQNGYKQLKPFYTAAETRDWKQFHILKIQVCVSLWTGRNLLWNFSWFHKSGVDDDTLLHGACIVMNVLGIVSRQGAGESWVRIRVGPGYFSLFQNCRTGCVSHPASHSVSEGRRSLLGVKWPMQAI